MHSRIPAILIVLSLVTNACGSAIRPPATVTSAPQNGATRAGEVLAVESFLADIAQNVAGDRMQVDALIPLGVDPHSFEPTPGDVRKIADSRVLIINGAGFEEWLKQTLENAGGERTTIEASAGLTSREAREGEALMGHVDEAEPSRDPHFWLDPVLAVRYVENIRDGLSQVDPEGTQEYTRNAEAYTTKLRELDHWIVEQVKEVPADRRKIVTNHESFGYFADRYGFEIIGTIMPSVSTDASPSARQLAQLVDRIRLTGVPAVFLETGTNPQLAEQISRETGIKVVTDLYSHSLTDAQGAAPTYLEMMRHNTQAVVGALNSSP